MHEARRGGQEQRPPERGPPGVAGTMVVTMLQKMGQSKEVYDALKFLQVPGCQ
ncbi:unnamed protein product, partial [Pylaiella littoralis]